MSAVIGNGRIELDVSDCPEMVYRLDFVELPVIRVYTSCIV